MGLQIYTISYVWSLLTNIDNNYYDQQRNSVRRCRVALKICKCKYLLQESWMLGSYSTWIYWYLQMYYTNTSKYIITLLKADFATIPNLPPCSSLPPHIHKNPNSRRRCIIAIRQQVTSNFCPNPIGLESFWISSVIHLNNWM